MISAEESPSTQSNLRQTFMSSQMPQTGNSNLAVRPSALKFFSSGHTTKQPDPAAKQQEWTSQYLAGLRAHQNTRPSGPKPLPSRSTTGSLLSKPDPFVRASSALSLSTPNHLPSDEAASQDRPQERSSSALSHSRSHSALSVTGPGFQRGRSLVQSPQAPTASRNVSTSSIIINIPKGPAYIERGSRWMEKQEARSVREALEDMDLRDEIKLHKAAQDEASQLVWKHRHPGIPYPNPEMKKNYKSHLEKSAHARSQSLAHFADGRLLESKIERTCEDLSLSGSSTVINRKPFHPKNQQEDSCSQAEQEAVNHCTNHNASSKIHGRWDSPQKQAYLNLAFHIPTIRPTGRRVSSGKKRNVSGSVFSNPEDKIYEEPEEVANNSATPAKTVQDPLGPPKATARNPVTKMNSNIVDCFDRKKGSVHDQPRVSRSEIHQNPPSQSRDPSYVRNQYSHQSTLDSRLEEQGTNFGSPRMKDGVEIRDDDIRAATSKRLSDRSSKLPWPTIVSDRPGRPIVSFSQDWRLEEKSAHAGRPDAHSKPGSTSSAPIIPSIVTPSTPTIQVDAAPCVPSTSVSETPSVPADPILPSSTTSIPSLPRPSADARRPKPTNFSTTPSHWAYGVAGSRGGTALCAACALPISGRIVSTSSQRFHPACFSCYHCAELLECVAFYPEPDSHRASRLERATSDEADNPEDADESLRFYCHLDFHELFSPRCRSCKTPIEGEVVVACGGEWHVGHFFCAECGDPFGPQDPFVEKEGYAWCVRCHQQRSASRCRGCKKPVIDGGVEALGAQWHGECFRCTVSFAVPVHHARAETSNNGL